MVNRCVAYGCSNTHKNNVSLHKFPSDPEVRSRWDNAVRRTRADWKCATGSSRLCSDHFLEAAFAPECSLMREFGLQTGRVCRRLRPDAVPTEFRKAPIPGSIVSVPKKPRLSGAVTRRQKQEIEEIQTKKYEQEEEEEIEVHVTSSEGEEGGISEAELAETDCTSVTGVVFHHKSTQVSVKRTPHRTIGIQCRPVNKSSRKDASVQTEDRRVLPSTASLLLSSRTASVSHAGKREASTS